MQFIEAVGLNKKKYHVMGTSLGGYIAGMHAATFPDNIVSTTLVCPAGIEASRRSHLWKAYEEDNKIMLLPDSDDEFIEMIKMLVHKPVTFPRIIVSGIMQARKQGHGFYYRSKLLHRSYILISSSLRQSQFIELYQNEARDWT